MSQGDISPVLIYGEYLGMWDDLPTEAINIFSHYVSPNKYSFIPGRFCIYAEQQSSSSLRSVFAV